MSAPAPATPGLAFLAAIAAAESKDPAFELWVLEGHVYIRVHSKADTIMVTADAKDFEHLRDLLCVQFPKE